MKSVDSVEWKLKEIPVIDVEEEEETEGEEVDFSFLRRRREKKAFVDEPREEVKKDYENLEVIERSCRVIQKYIQKWRAWKKVRNLRRFKGRRRNLALEILQTERDYLHHLRVCFEVYWKNLKQMATEKKYGFTFDDFIAIFTRSYGSMKMCHDIFLDDLEKVVGGEREYTHFCTISQCFLKIAPFFKTYKNYCVNFPLAMRHIRELKKNNSEFGMRLRELDRDIRTTRLGLTSYMILPISRIPRYRMLLRDLLKYTEEEHPEFHNLKKAFSKICEVSRFLDDAINRFECREKVRKIDEELKPNPYFSVSLNPHRRWISSFQFLKGGLELVRINGEEMPKISHTVSLFLFSDVLCLTKIILKEKHQYEYLIHFPMESVQVYISEEFGEKVRLKNLMYNDSCGDEVILNFGKTVHSYEKKSYFLEKMKWTKKDYLEFRISKDGRKKVDRTDPDVLERRKFLESGLNFRIIFTGNKSVIWIPIKSFLFI